jgi:hypothetical protein
MKLRRLNTARRMTSLHHLHILVGIQTDATLYHGEHARRPALLDAPQAQQVLAHVATELKRTLPWTQRCALGMAGTLFDQAQVLRPGLPVFAALETARQAADSPPALFAISAEDGCMSDAGLQPDAAIQPGSLQLLPLLVTGPADELQVADDALEQAFAGNGLLSSAALNSLTEHFHVTAMHARFMTLSKLGMLLRRQLEHYGCLPLWELLDAALNAQEDPLEVLTPLGARFCWDGSVVHGEFQTFDDWARYGAGAAMPAAGQRLHAAYVDWTREARRYQSKLSKHGIRVEWRLKDGENVKSKGSFMVERSTAVPRKHAAAMTEHSAGELGTVAVSLVSGDRQLNFYPLQAEGVNELHRHIREQGLGGSIDYPGCIRYDEDSRQLVAGTLPPDSR